MTDIHLIQTIASAIERGVPQHVESAHHDDGFDEWEEPGPIGSTDAREFARALLTDLAAAGFRIVREEMAHA